PIHLPESAPGINDPIEAKATSKDVSARRNYAWAYLMARVFQLDVLECERCGSSRLRRLASIHPPDTTQKILNCLAIARPAFPPTPSGICRSRNSRQNLDAAPPGIPGHGWLVPRADVLRSAPAAIKSLTVSFGFTSGHSPV